MSYNRTKNAYKRPGRSLVRTSAAVGVGLAVRSPGPGVLPSRNCTQNPPSGWLDPRGTRTADRSGASDADATRAAGVFPGKPRRACVSRAVVAADENDGHRGCSPWCVTADCGAHHSGVSLWLRREERAHRRERFGRHGRRRRFIRRPGHGYAASRRDARSRSQSNRVSALRISRKGARRSSFSDPGPSGAVRTSDWKSQ